MHQSDSYYAEFTRACDSLLAQQHFAANEVEEVSTTDVSLPRIIRNMRPRRVKLRPHHVWLQIGESRADGFGILWKQDDIQTNIWNLTVAGESLHRVLYTTNKQQAAVR